MKIRLLLAGSAMALAFAPLTTAPAHAMTCAPDFEAACFVIGTACHAADKYCELG